MDPDSPSTSPFQAPPDGSPFRPEPEQPRLGILHLLVWTACVAVYFSITRAFYGEDVLTRNPSHAVFWLAGGFGSGAALGGLLLLVARRYRGLPFPTQPGETLLVLLGVAVMIHLAWCLLSLAVTAEGTNTQSIRFEWVRVRQLAMPLVLGVLYLVAAIRTKVTRWRLYFVAVVVADALMFVFPCAGVIYWWRSGRWSIVLQTGPRLFPLLVLVPTALADVFQGLRYRWTHWLGVGLALFNGIILAVWLAQWILFWPERI